MTAQAVTAPKKPAVKLKTFTLKQNHFGLKAGKDTLTLGPKGEQFYKSKNLI